jgi:hypothetical protein
MKLVKFNDGTYGVRKYWLFGWHFVDLKDPQFSWTFGSIYFCCCKGSEERAREVLKSKRAKRYEVIE